MLISLLASVIIRQLHFKSVAFDKPKADPPLVVHGDGILALAVPLQLMEPITGRDSEIFQTWR